MSALYKLMLGSAAVACAFLVQAQTSDTSSSAGGKTASGSSAAATDQSGKSGSTDPFVEKRNEQSKAKKEYKSGKISKDEYRAEKKSLNKDLGATGQRNLSEQNIEIPKTGPGTSSSGR